MNIREILDRDSVLLSVAIPSTAILFQRVGTHVAELADARAALVQEALLERDQQGNNAATDGVYIPHARIDGLRQAIGMFVRPTRPVDCHASDKKPADLIFVLLVPKGADTAHIKALAKVSRILRDKEQRAILRSTPSKQEVYEILTQFDG